jgi:hypothetical protein
MTAWNRVRFDAGRGKSHVESYFIKLNDDSGQKALWLKATILAGPDRAPLAEAWAIAFDRQVGHAAVKQVVPHSEARFGAHDLDLSVAGIEMSEGKTRGAIASGEHRIEWDLVFDTGGPPLVPYPHPKMYEGPLPSQKLVSPHPDSKFSGSYRVDGREVKVEAWRGMQGHNWGKRHTELYAWGHVNQWDDAEDLLLEGVTARVKMGPILVPPLTLVCVWHKGRRYELNDTKTLLKAKGSISPGVWRFHSRSKEAEIEGELRAENSETAGLYYENPNGEMTYCLNSKIAHAELTLSPKDGPVVRARSRAAALEIGTKNADHGVKMLV